MTKVRLKCDIDVLFKEGKFQWRRLENLITIAQTKGNFDLLPTASQGLQYLLSDEGLYLRQQLLIALTEDDRLHTEEVQRLWELIKADLSPSRVLGVAWGAISDFSREQATALVPPMAGLANVFQGQLSR